jgi:hypothetical protein
MRLNITCAEKYPPGLPVPRADGFKKDEVEK